MHYIFTRSMTLGRSFFPTFARPLGRSDDDRTVGHLQFKLFCQSGLFDDAFRQANALGIADSD
jgi:hypothetical protein